MDKNDTYNNEANFFVDIPELTLDSLLEKETGSISGYLITPLHDSISAVYKSLTSTINTKEDQELLKLQLNTVVKSINKTMVIVTALENGNVLDEVQITELREFLDKALDSMEHALSVVDKQIIAPPIKDVLGKHYDTANIATMVVGTIAVSVIGYKLYKFIEGKYFNDITVTFDD